MGAKSKLMKKPGAAGVLKGSGTAGVLKGKLTSSTIAIHEETAKDRIDKLHQKVVEWEGQISEEDFVGRDKHRLWKRRQRGHGKIDQEVQDALYMDQGSNLGQHLSDTTRPAVLLIVAVNMKAIHKPHAIL
jgi:hypothetical protein